MLEVSIIIPTYNRLEQLKRVLRALEAQAFPLSAFEVIVVCDGATDGTAEFLATAVTELQLHPILQTNQGVAAARNHGIAEARGELVLFIDDDVVPAPWLLPEHMVSHAAAGPDAIVLGPMLTPDDFQMAPWVAWEQAMLVKQYDAMAAGLWTPTARQFYTGNTSLRRAHLLQAGGFDPQFRRAEDVELAYRLSDAGLHFVFNPRATGFHYAERSFSSWLAIPYAYGRNDVIFARDRGQRWLLPTVQREFREERHAFIRALTRLCLDRPAASRMVLRSLRLLGWGADSIGLQRLSNMAYSGIFNLRYYQGMADELGGRAAFFDLTVEAKANPPVNEIAAAWERPFSAVPERKNDVS